MCRKQMAQGASMAFLALLSASLLAKSHAQSIQTGILYWCSFIEGGPNTATYSSSPRTTILGQGAGYYAGPCHLLYSPNIPFAYQPSSSIAYTFSNGSAYPNNQACSTYPYCPYGIAPTSCLVRIRCTIRNGVRYFGA